MAAKTTGRKPTERFNFTKRALLSYKPPAEGRRYVFDEKVPSLALQVTATGSMAFYRVGRVKGRPARVRIGPFPTLSVEQARDRAAEINLEIARGNDPVSERRSVRQEATLKSLFDTYLELHAKPHKRRWNDDKKQFDRYLKSWEHRKLSDISRTDVADLHARLGKKHGPYAANRLLALLSVMFNFAVERGWNGTNPATGIQRFKEKSRERFLSPDELKRFLSALKDEPDPLWRDFFLTLLFTGARRSNVQAMAWADISLDRGLWRIPHEASKSGEPLLVVLPPPAMRVLELRAESANGSPWVFPSVSKTGHITEPKKAWSALLERAKITDFRLHDLRRTLEAIPKPL